MYRVLICAAAAAAMLTACNKPAAPGAPAAGGTATPGAAPKVAAGPLKMDALPAPKAGLWHSVTTTEGQARPVEADICMAGVPIDMTKNGPKCDGLSAMGTPTGGFTVDGDCPNGNMNAKMHVQAEGDFNSRYATDASITISGGPGPPMTLKSHNEMTYRGPCPAGMSAAK